MQPRQARVSGRHANDARDVAAAQDGDERAFERLLWRHETAVARQMWRFSRDALAHRELVQEVFVRAWESLPGYRGEGAFLHWLRKIAVRTGYAYWRRQHTRRREQTLDPALAARLTEDPADHTPSQAAALVHDALARLAPRNRTVLTLLYLDGRSVAEAAELLGWSRSMVKVQAWRARAKMKQLLASTGMEE